MKKIFTLILFFAAVAVSAQSLSLMHNGSELQNGDTIVMNVTSLGIECSAYLDIVNHSSQDVSVKAYKNELEMVPGAEACLCFAGNCWPPSQRVAGPVTIEADSILHGTDPTGFHFAYTTLTDGISYVKFAFVNEENADDEAVVVFKAVANTTAVPTMTVASSLRAYPNPASESTNIEYSYKGNAANLNLVVKNLMGATVYTRALDPNANKVQLDVSEYVAGIYFYSLEADNRPVVTKKLLVK